MKNDESPDISAVTPDCYITTKGLVKNVALALRENQTTWVQILAPSLMAVYLWASDILSLGFCFLICKGGSY